jgi:hypothetical protein
MWARGLLAVLPHTVKLCGIAAFLLNFVAATERLVVLVERK